MLINKFIPFLISVLSLCCLSFWEKDYKKLTMQNGMPDNTVYAIFRDDIGFMWFGTEGGLTRYDGTTLKTFALDTRNQVVEQISGSSCEKLWIWGGGTLHCFDRKQERFAQIENEQILSDNNTRYAVVFGDSVIYMMCKDRVLSGTIGKGHSGANMLITIDKKPYIQVAGDYFCDIAVDKTGDLYGVTGSGLVVWRSAGDGSIKTNRLDLRYPSPGQVDIPIRSIQIIDRSLWISTLGSGLVRYFIDTGEYHQIESTGASSGVKIPHDGVYGVAKIGQSNYVVVTWNGYCSITYDNTDSQPIRSKIYDNTYSDVHRNIESRIQCVYADADKVVWFGTYGGGVFSSNLLDQFYWQTHQGGANEIKAMIFDKQQHLYLSTFHKGIMRSREPFDAKATPEFDQIFRNSEGGGALANDTRGNTWGGSYRGSIIEFDGRRVKREIKVSSNESFQKVRTLYFDNRDNVWVGTSGGLIRHDLIDSKNYLLDALLGYDVRQIAHEPNTGRLWLATDRGVACFDPHNERATVPQEGYYTNSIIVSGRTGAIYAGTMDGLLVIENPAKPDSAKLYTTANGLCNNFIACIIEEPSGNIWVGNNSSISRLSPPDGIFYNYYIQGNNRSCVEYRDGTLLWGNNKSISYFNPDTLNSFYDRILLRRVVITDMEVSGRVVRVGDTINSQVVLHESLLYTNRVRLSAANNSFALHVSDLLFATTDSRYEYRLLPIQQQWIASKHGERITYAALPAGEYTFQVRPFSAAAASPLTELQIEIEAHWVYSWWVKLIALFFVLAVGLWLFVRITSRFKRRLYVSKLRAELQTQRAELDRERQINRERIKLFAYASHELRTPLTLIISPIEEMLAHDRLNPEIYDRLKLMGKSASSLLELVDKLLYVQKIDSKMVELNVRRVEIVQLVSRIVESFEPMRAEFGVKITIENRTPSPEVWLFVDEQQIESAIVNLVANSIKYRRTDNPVVDISIEESTSDGTEYTIISVADNGQGISHEIQRNIFESFTTDARTLEMTDSAQFAPASKIGMGLFIVRKIIEMHHGKIELRSEPAEGSIFRLFIPKDDFHFKSTAQVSSHSTQAAQSSPRRTILVVEDNSDMSSYITMLFERDYRVLTALTGRQGLEIATAELPDLVLQDIMLPDINGVECCRMLSENTLTSHIPVVMLSCKSDEQSVVEALGFGAADYVAKPFNPQILKTKVSTLINSREVLKRIFSKTLMLKPTVEGLPSQDNFIQKIINVTQANLTDSNFGVEQLAEKLFMSSSTLRRMIKSHTSLSVNEIVRNVRLTKAASLLMESDYRVNEIAELVGYNDISTFRKQFTKKFDISPSRFQGE